MRRRQRWWIASAVLIALTYVLGAAPAYAADVPYDDPSSAGALGFCDGSGHEVTSGQITDRPFAAFAVSSFRPPDPYDQAGGKATLYAYQPRKGYAPGTWSGMQLTSASTYSVPQYPKVEVLPADSTLANMNANYPPQWDGYLQLRVYFGAPGEGIFKDQYPSADIKVSGDTWKLVRGGGVSCVKSGTATSVLRALAPNLVTSTGPASTSNGNGSASSGPAPSASTDVLIPKAAASASSSAAKKSSSSQAWLLPVVVIAAAGAMGGGFIAYRNVVRRGSASPSGS